MRSVARQIPAGSDTIGVLDLGSSKVACIIARQAPDTDVASDLGGLKILGIGHQRSHGVKAGVILDLDQAEAAIRAAVDQAERMAGITLSSVYVSIACGRLRSLNFAARAEVENGIVGDDEIARVLAGARAYAERDGRRLVHLARIGYRLDGGPGVREPRGMAASMLAADLHAVTADEGPVRNLLLAVERCHLATTGLVATPYAAALAVTTPQERRLGVTVVDIGGGTATIAMFAEDHFLHADVLPVGGNHMTFDIARTLSMPLVEAERIKALYGTMVRARSDEHETISYPAAGEDDGELRHTTKAELHALLRPRVDSILTLVRERIQAAPTARFAEARLVLTGGASQMVGLGAYAAELLACPVRVARPQPIGGLPPNACSPAFAVVVGMLHAAAAGDIQAAVEPHGTAQAGGYLRRVGDWLQEF